jgi:hypothetical protein
MAATPAATNQKSPYDPEKRPVEDHPVPAYGRALQVLDDAGVPYLVGGGLAMLRYGAARDTKDLDIFIHRGDAERAMDALSLSGFTTLETDLNWLRKAQMTDVYIDLILWSKGPIDLTPEEVDRAAHITIDGIPIRVFAPEDLLLRKIYVMRDDGLDWSDAFSIIDAAGPSLDWSLFERDGLDPLQMTGFLLIAEARRPGAIPEHVLARHLSRAQSSVPARISPGAATA